jgi:predicted ester cyclase
MNAGERGWITGFRSAWMHEVVEARHGRCGKTMCGALALLLVSVLFLGVFPVGAQGQPTPVYKERVWAALEAFSAGDQEAIPALFEETFLFNGVESSLDETIRPVIMAYHAALPDLQMTPEVLLAQEDWVAAGVIWAGTFSAPLQLEAEVMPTGDRVSWTMMYFFRLNEAAQVVEFWLADDPSDLYTALGVMPPAEDTALGTPAEMPVGYQRLTADEYAATLVSGREARNLGLFQQLADLGLGIYPQFYTDPYLQWIAGMPSWVTAQDAEENAPFEAMIRTALPNYTLSPEVTVAEGDWVAALMTFQGTFTEAFDFFGTPLSPTNEEIVFQIGVVVRYNAEDKIVEEWMEGDYSPLITGLGIMPPEVNNP